MDSELGGRSKRELSRRFLVRAFWFGLGVIAFVAGVAALGFLREFDPSQHSFYPPCAFHQLTGMHCPGCGATRATHALLNGDVWRAIRCNGLLILGGPLFVLALLWQRHLERRNRGSYSCLAFVALICVLVFFLARNIPSAELSPFAPPR